MVGAFVPAVTEVVSSMDFRADTHPPQPRRASPATRAPDVAPGAPPRGQGRRLPASRADEREPRRTSRRRRRTIAEVAAATGFVDAAHFTRSYRARFGTTPSQERDGASEGRR